MVRGLLRQGLLLSWQNRCFQRYTVPIQSSAKNYIEHLFPVNCIEKKKIKRRRKWPIFKKERVFKIIVSVKSTQKTKNGHTNTAKLMGVNKSYLSPSSKANTVKILYHISVR